MDTATNTDEVRLHKGESLNERLVFAGLAIGLCVLGLATPEPVDNPLDSTNTDIRLGKPAELKTRSGDRGLVVLVAGLMSIPFIVALWNGELSGLGAIVWALGLIVAAVVFRYAHRM